MTVEVSKLTAFAITSPTGGVTVSKLTAFVILAPGTESGGAAPVHSGFTYGHRLRQSNG